MERYSRVQYAAMILSVLLPYGVMTYDTAIMTTNQEWIFSFWILINVFNGWHSFGIVPLSWFRLPLVPLGLLWFILGLLSSRLLYEFYLGQVRQRLLILVLFGALASQLVLTSLGLLYVLNGNMIGNIIVVPLPIHTLLILMFALLAPRLRVT